MDKFKNIQLSTYEKLGLAWGILVILIIIALAVRLFSPKPANKSTPQVPKEASKVVPTALPTVEPVIGRIFITPSQKSVKAGESATFDVMFQTKGQILDGVDAIIRFDPQLLAASETVTLGTHFDSYPRQEVDNITGIIKVSGYSPKDLSPVTAATSLFSVTFQAKKTGTADVTVDFEKGRTNLSTLVERGTSKNILGAVGNVKIVIE